MMALHRQAAQARARVMCAVVCAAFVAQCHGATAQAPTPKQLAAELAQAVQAGQPAFTIPPGVYPFGKTDLNVSGASSLNLTADGATLVFAPGYGFAVDGSHDVRITGATVAYDPPCFTQGRISAVDAAASTVDVVLDAGFPDPQPAVSPYFNVAETKVLYWTPSEQGPGSGHPFEFARGQSAVSPLLSVQNLTSPGGGARARRLFVDPVLFKRFVPTAGMYVSVSPRIYARYANETVPGYYAGQTWTVYNSTRVTSQNITITGGGDFAILEWGGGGGHVYDGVVLERPSASVVAQVVTARDMQRRSAANGTALAHTAGAHLDGPVPKGHLLSSNCDAFHSFSTRVGPTVTRCRFGDQGDDFLNFHNRVQVVLDAGDSATRPALIVDVGDVPPLQHTGQGSGLQNSARSFESVMAGDSVRVFSVASDGRTRTAAGFITAAGRPHLLRDAATVGKALKVLDALPFKITGIAREAVAVWSLPVAPTSNSSAARPGDIVTYDGMSSAGGSVLDNHFQFAYDNAFRLQASNTTVRGNTFANCSGGVHVVFDAAFMEGSAGILDITIEDNVFFGVAGSRAGDVSSVFNADPDAGPITLRNNTVIP